MNTLSLGEGNEIILEGFSELEDNSDITVKVIKERLILCLGHHFTDAAHIRTRLQNRSIFHTQLYAVLHHHGSGKPLSFIKSSSPNVEYIQLS